MLAAERRWFSDGGISSNFPVHFFDSPVPTRPTFAIDLTGFRAGQAPDPNQCENVWLPKNNRAGCSRTGTASTPGPG